MASLPCGISMVFVVWTKKEHVCRLDGDIHSGRDPIYKIEISGLILTGRAREMSLILFRGNSQFLYLRGWDCILEMD